MRIGRRRKRTAPLPPPENEKARINDRIRCKEVRLIDEEGQQVGVTPIAQAIEMAEKAELDLVEISPTAKPPVCKIMNYSKFLFELQKKEKAAKQKQRKAIVETKEIRLRPGTDSGDLKRKVEKAKEFIAAGNKVAIQLQFRGREMAHREIGLEMIDKFAGMIEDVAKIEQRPSMQGRRMSALFGPSSHATPQAPPKEKKKVEEVVIEKTEEKTDEKTEE